MVVERDGGVGGGIAALVPVQPHAEVNTVWHASWPRAPGAPVPEQVFARRRWKFALTRGGVLLEMLKVDVTPPPPPHPPAHPHPPPHPPPLRRLLLLSGLV